VAFWVFGSTQFNALNQRRDWAMAKLPEEEAALYSEYVDTLSRAYLPHRNNKEKRESIESVLRDRLGWSLSNRIVARYCGTSPSLVATVRRAICGA
jgi:hypothetical protein